MRRREVLVAATGGLLVRPARAAAADRDPEILIDLIAREEAAAFAYRAQARPAIFALAGHEAAHAEALRTLLAAFDRQAPPAPRKSAELDPVARRAFETGEALPLEDSLLAAYRSALLQLVEPSILRTAATIMASHSQHRALLAAG